MRDGNARVWPASLAAVAGSAIVGFMPLLALRLYAAGLAAPSMLFWRYGLALPVLGIALWLNGLGPLRAWRVGAWRIAAVGATLGAAQTLCFWQSLKTLETSIAVLLFYTYPAVTMLLERAIYKRPIRPIAVLCIAVILLGAGLITAPGLRGGTIDMRGVLWALPSPLIYALYLAINANLMRRHHPLIGASFLYLGMLAAFAAIVATIGLDVPTTPATWALLALVAIGPGALTVTLFSFSVPLLGPSSYAIIANVELVTVVAIGILWLGEPLTLGRAVGGAMIVVGILTHALARGASSAPEPAPSRPARASEGPVAPAAGA